MKQYLKTNGLHRKKMHFPHVMKSFKMLRKSVLMWWLRDTIKGPGLFLVLFFTSHLCIYLCQNGYKMAVLCPYEFYVFLPAQRKGKAKSGWVRKKNGFFQSYPLNLLFILLGGTSIHMLIHSCQGIWEGVVSYPGQNMNSVCKEVKGSLAHILYSTITGNGLAWSSVIEFKSM